MTQTFNTSGLSLNSLKLVLIARRAILRAGPVANPHVTPQLSFLS